MLIFVEAHHKGLPSRTQLFFGTEGDAISLIFEWHPIAELAHLALPLYPKMLRTALSNLPLTLTHMVMREP